MFGGDEGAGGGEGFRGGFGVDVCFGDLESVSGALGFLLWLCCGVFLAEDVGWGMRWTYMGEIRGRLVRRPFFLRVDLIRCRFLFRFV